LAPNAHATIADDFMMGADRLLSGLLFLLMMIMLAVLAALAISAGLMADLMIVIGIAFGPLILALYPLIRNWLGNLLGFMAGAIMMKPIVAFVVAGCIEALKTLIGQSQLAQTVGEGRLIKVSSTLAAMALLALLIFLMLSLPGIVSSLFGGSLAIGPGTAATRMGKQAAGGMARVGVAGGKIGGKMAAQGAKQIKAAVLSKLGGGGAKP